MRRRIVSAASVTGNLEQLHHFLDYYLMCLTGLCAGMQCVRIVSCSSVTFYHSRRASTVHLIDQEPEALERSAKINVVNILLSTISTVQELHLMMLERGVA